MIELLSQGGLAPFLTAAILVVLLFILEVTLMMLGLSSSGESDALDMDVDIDTGILDMSAADISAEFNIDANLAAQIEAEISVGTGGAGTTGFADDAAIPAGETSALGNVLDLLGIRRLPLTVWLALFSAGFASSGLAFQVLLHSATGTMLPAIVASLLALIPATIIARGLSGWISRMIPRDETSAISERSLGRRRGVVTVGIAKRGQPAQVRITDHHGNSHYTMIEPFTDTDEIAEGTEVLVLRTRLGQLRLVPLE